MLRAGAAALAAVGVVGAVPPAVASASPQQALDWTKQAPATSPSARVGTSMAYDTATGTVVLFGGSSDNSGSSNFSDTWTWDGTTWTRHVVAVHPSPRSDAVMAYDAANGTVVLFGGGDLNDTWAWDGTTWTEQHPATSPPARAFGASMAYDAATGTVVLFGGDSGHGQLNDTWTWDGTTWTEQHPATSPSARYGASMAYDAATGTVVLFGGWGGGILNDTWTWDGTTWTKEAPAAHPAARTLAYMAYDAATSTVVLFGGTDGTGTCQQGSTWTWDGTTWTNQAPATSPTARAEGAMAYDAATGTAVLFGGFSRTTRCTGPDQYWQQTWTWG